MTDIISYSSTHLPADEEFNRIAAFLHQHLEQFGDPPGDIRLAMDYALAKNGKPGGVIITALDNTDIVAATVINKTGMLRYIPENILVYIATDAARRGKGIGRKLMEKAIELTEGDIALHVEPDNPARKLYERLGFTNKYLEMRLKKGNNRGLHNT